ncbi:hypothetical protein BO99DRAFT_11432 [Aspergillus violaceofuscus CBS 115571]|uniref:Uncharacterized protein n=1 Tax=Aspergillus violaceofuscus (strain CBS 115571) TaxID=1450538 RepID=A0A2V5GU45_ASPV1|nr:hypothetical protein BO99DRAFT_11432 [Aspergillus violaceofuscus CBS 115571]
MRAVDSLPGLLFALIGRGHITLDKQTVPTVSIALTMLRRTHAILTKPLSHGHGSTEILNATGGSAALGSGPAASRTSVQYL